MVTFIILLFSKGIVMTYVFSIVLVELCGFIVGMLTRSGTALYATTINKPPFSPPGILFPIAWTILYALMGIGLACVIMVKPSTSRTRGIIFFVIQFILNLAWCFIFFGARDYVFALVELIAMFVAVICMTVSFAKVDALSAKLQIPYILWLCFATYLNIGVIVLNK